LTLPKEKNKLNYIGYVIIKARGHFNIQTKNSENSGGTHKYGCVLKTANGYEYKSLTYPKDLIKISGSAPTLEPLTIALEGYF
jgi:hypothetical protein